MPISVVVSSTVNFITFFSAAMFFSTFFLLMLAAYAQYLSNGHRQCKIEKKSWNSRNYFWPHACLSFHNRHNPMVRMSNLARSSPRSLVQWILEKKMHIAVPVVSVKARPFVKQIKIKKICTANKQKTSKTIIDCPK